MEPTKLLVSGDWHGEFRAAQASAREARRTGCDAIFQVGDFGYWPHTNPDYVMQVNAAMRRASKRDPALNVYWIDGNHENFDMLFAGEWEKTPEGFWQIADHVFYVPRTTRWEWSGVKFLALGGGHSIDKQWRLSQGPVGLYWWPQETIKLREVYECLSGGEVDVMFTHDMPEGTELGITLYKLDSEDEQNRIAVRTVADAVKPKHLFHGHYHHRNESLLRINDNRPIAVHSLGMWQGGMDDHNADCWTVLALNQAKQEVAA